MFNIRTREKRERDTEKESEEKKNTSFAFQSSIMMSLIINEIKITNEITRERKRRTSETMCSFVI